MYLSYKQSLEFFYDKMIVGGYIIFDDYNSRVCEGATIAINEFFLNKKENVLKTNDDVYFFIKE
jgi:O-methyltransferase